MPYSCDEKCHHTWIIVHPDSIQVPGEDISDIVHGKSSVSGLCVVTPVMIRKRNVITMRTKEDMFHSSCIQSSNTHIQGESKNCDEINHWWTVNIKSGIVPSLHTITAEMTTPNYISTRNNATSVDWLISLFLAKYIVVLLQGTDWHLMKAVNMPSYMSSILKTK